MLGVSPLTGAVLPAKYWPNDGVTLRARRSRPRRWLSRTVVEARVQSVAISIASPFTVQAEMLEARMVNGEAIDIATLCTLASTTVRLSQRLGLERRARNVTPSLGQYLAARTAPVTGGMDAEGTE